MLDKHKHTKNGLFYCKFFFLSSDLALIVVCTLQGCIFSSRFFKIFRDRFILKNSIFQSTEIFFCQTQSKFCLKLIRIKHTVIYCNKEKNEVE